MLPEKDKPERKITCTKCNSEEIIQKLEVENEYICNKCNNSFKVPSIMEWIK